MKKNRLAKGLLGVVSIPPKGVTLSESQLNGLYWHALHDGEIIPLSSNQKKQLAEYMIKQAHTYQSSHSMNRTILTACIKQIV